MEAATYRYRTGSTFQLQMGGPCPVAASPCGNLLTIPDWEVVQHPTSNQHRRRRRRASPPPQHNSTIRTTCTSSLLLVGKPPETVGNWSHSSEKHNGEQFAPTRLDADLTAAPIIPNLVGLSAHTRSTRSRNHYVPTSRLSGAV